MKKRKSPKVSKTTAANLEDRFDNGESVLDYFDTKNAIRRINLDIPEWAIFALDEEAERRGIARQALVKNWLIDKIDEAKKNQLPKTDPRLGR